MGTRASRVRNKSRNSTDCKNDSNGKNSRDNNPHFVNHSSSHTA